MNLQWIIQHKVCLLSVATGLFLFIVFILNEDQIRLFEKCLQFNRLAAAIRKVSLSVHRCIERAAEWLIYQGL